MNLLGATYESARINIPPRLFPARHAVKPWPELDEGVRTELAQLVRKVRSVVRVGDLRLASYGRVVVEFNRGVRDGFFAVGAAAGTMTGAPYDWGHALGRQANQRRSTDPVAVKQFITATHLLGYEFAQLDQVEPGAYDFIVRNVGPQRADELGALAFALPVLINYRRALVQQILDDEEFSLAQYHANRPAAPSHLEYLTHGIVALFDRAPESWIQVAANMTLATQPFADGGRLQDEHFQAPEQAAQAVLAAPIAAWHAVQRQVERVLLAREWLSSDNRDLQFDLDTAGPVTLWNVYQGTPGSRIRGADAFAGDVVASNTIYLISRYFESVIPAEQTGFQFLRRHFSAFTRGFDSRVEGVVDPQALASAARGRACSHGLRRFANGGPMIAHVSAQLQALGATLNELHHALNDPVSFVLEQLEANHETPLAAHLLELFRHHASLPRHLFAEDAHFELFSMTHVKTRSTFDLLRSALYLVACAVGPDRVSRDESATQLARARQDLVRIGQASAGDAADPQSGPAPSPSEQRLVVAAALFREDFETLVRLMRRLVHRLHHARALGKPQPALSSDGMRPRRGASIDAA